MTRYAFLIDQDRCIGCQACVVACKAGNERPLGSNYVEIRETVRGQLPNLVGSFAHHRCFHCADAACVTVCPTGTLSKWNGLTVVNMDKCSGCGYCTDACPYKVPTLANDRVSKCVACFDLVQEGQTPWCAQTCPSQAIQFDERDKLLAEAKTRVAALKARHVNAQVYGEAQLGGLGLLMILLDEPAVFGLPEAPQTPAQLDVWQRVAQPASIGISALSVVVTGLAFIIARRQHQREKAVAHESAEPVETTSAKTHAPAAVMQPQPAQPSRRDVQAEPLPKPALPPQAAPGKGDKAQAVIQDAQLQAALGKDGAKTGAPAAKAQPRPALPPQAALGKDDKAQAVAKGTQPQAALGKDEAETRAPAAKVQPKPAQPSGDKQQGGR
jgi:formate dehydrogenase iron-sulfur subunit